MLILHDQKRVYGGAYVRISTPNHPLVLGIEQDILPPPGKLYFSLREQFPELALGKYAYAELGGFLLHPSMRTSSIIRQMMFSALAHCLDCQVRYFFILSDRARTRLYRQVYSAAGVNCTLCDKLDIPMRPEYEGLKMYLLLGDTKPENAALGDPDAAGLLEPVDKLSSADSRPAA